MNTQPMQRCITCGASYYGAHVCAEITTVSKGDPKALQALRDPAPQDRHRSINAATSKLAAEIELDLLRKVIREELDRKPDGWMEYAEACVAVFDYANTEIDDWKAGHLAHLNDAAHEARRKYYARRPS